MRIYAIFKKLVVFVPILTAIAFGPCAAIPTVLPANTPVNLVLKVAMVSGRAVVGDIVEYELSESVNSTDGIALITKGAIAKGKVTVSQKKKLLKKGKLQFTVEDIVAVDGTHVPLRSVKDTIGVSASPFSVSWGAGGLPIPLGANVTADKGMKIVAFVDKAVTIDPAATYHTGQINPSDIDKLVKSIRGQIDKAQETVKVRCNGNVAIVPFELINLKTDSTSKNVSEDLSTALVNNGFRVVERSQLAKVLTELKLQDSGLVDVNSAKKIGELTGASILLLGSVSDRGSSLVINARLVETKSGGVVVADRVEVLKSVSANNSAVMPPPPVYYESSTKP